MSGRRVLVMVISAAGALGAFALLFGNQWFSRWIFEQDLDRGFTRFFLDWMRFPGWRIADDHSGPFGIQAGYDVGLLAFLGLLALLVFVGARGLDPNRGVAGALVLGWWATAVSGAVAGWLRFMIWKAVEDFPESSVAFGIQGGATFGVVFGWLMGLATMFAYLATRPKIAPGMPGMPGVPPAPQPSGMLPPQHPASAPYVPPPPLPGRQPPGPPPGQPPGQRPAWTPPPPSPASGPSGGYPMPPTPPAGLAPPMSHQPPPPPAEPQEPVAPVEPGDAVALAEPAQDATPEPVAPEPVAPEPEQPEQPEDQDEPQEPEAAEDSPEATRTDDDDRPLPPPG